MSPLDDELRAALRGRARDVHAPEDRLDGIRQRARGIRRRRTAGAVAASALAVAAVAVVVPSLMTAGEDRVGPQVATAPPSATPVPTRSPDPAPSPTAQPSPRAPASPYALDPADPWAYRGDPAVATAGDLEAYELQWAAVHGVSVDAVELVPLFGQVYEPSATPELVYLVRQASGEHWWGVARATESGPELVVDAPLPEEPIALAVGLPGDEVGRLLVVASPEIAAADYTAASTQREPVPLYRLEDGVLIGPLEGDPATDSLRVLAPDGTVLLDAPAPDPVSLAD
jgi:hypothetical protein